MCSLLVTTLAVPIGFVSFDYYECLLHLPACSVALQRLYPQLNHFNLGCNCEETWSRSSRSHSATPVSSPVGALPDLVMSHHPPPPASPSRLPTQYGPHEKPTAVSRSRRRSCVPGRSPRHGSVPPIPTPGSDALILFPGSHQQVQRCPPVVPVTDLECGDDDAFCEVPPHQMYEEGVRHILEVRHRFPEDLGPYFRRREFRLSWDSEEDFLEASAGSAPWDQGEGGPYTGGRLRKQELSRVGAQLRKIADDFEHNARKRTKTPTFTSSLTPVPKLMAQCFLFSFIGVFVYKTFFKK